MNARVERVGDRLAISGNMTLQAAKELFADGAAGVADGVSGFDLAAVDDIDSSGLAVLFGWQRSAQAQGRTIRIYNPPRNLISLAEVYGVTSLLPLA